MQSRTVQLALSTYECASRGDSVTTIGALPGDDSVPALLTSNSRSDNSSVPAISAADALADVLADTLADTLADALADTLADTLADALADIMGSAGFFTARFALGAATPDLLRCICFIANVEPHTLCN
jgi:hypothetical protein